MRIFLSAGEQSGDLHGAAVARELFALHPDIDLLGLGGMQMESAGARILYPLPQLALIGFVEVAKHLPEILKARRIIRKSWQKDRPDAIVLIDFPGLHLRLARLAHSLEIPVVYYIAPQMWAWGEHRVAALRECVKKLLLILPFEERFFRRRQVDSVFVGHPLMDAMTDIAPRPERTVSGDAVTIGLLPGSRAGEIRQMLPPMLDAAQRVRSMRKRVSFVLPLADTLDKSHVAGFRVPSWIEVVRDPDFRHRAGMDLAWTSSGTATIENAILGIPMVIVYRTGRINAMIARRVVRVPYIGLANLVAGYGVCPELIQEQACGETLAAWTLDFLDDEQGQRFQLQGLRRVREALGQPGASRRAAEVILEVATSETNHRVA